MGEGEGEGELLPLYLYICFDVSLPRQSTFGFPYVYSVKYGKWLYVHFDCGPYICFEKLRKVLAAAAFRVFRLQPQACGLQEGTSGFVLNQKVYGRLPMSLNISYT
jgi:hypothetical protein